MNNRTIVVHDVISPIYYIDLEDPHTRKIILEITREEIFELLQLYKDFSVKLPDVTNVNALFEFLVYEHFYDFSQPLGNALMSLDVAIKFTSSRRRTIQNDAYDLGSSNVVIPLSLYNDMPQNGTFYESRNNKVFKVSLRGESIFAEFRQ